MRTKSKTQSVSHEGTQIIDRSTGHLYLCLFLVFIRLDSSCGFYQQLSHPAFETKGINTVHITRYNTFQSNASPIQGKMLLGTPFSFRSKAKRQLVTKLEMAKGDGKKKRTKKEKSEDPSRTSTTTAISPIPQRVTSDINIPVRHQIQWAKMKKEYERASTSSFKAKNVKTAYRKKLGKAYQFPFLNLFVNNDL